MLEIPVLHRVRREGPWGLGPYRDYTATPEDLEHYLRARQGWARARLVPGGRLEVPSGERAFLVTFDDGYRDTLTEALPVLEAFDAPAVVSVTTGFVTGEAYPFELELAHVAADLTEIRDPETGERVALADADARRAVYERLRSRLRPLGPDQRAAGLRRLADANGYHRRDHQTEAFLDWDEVRRLDRHPLVTVAAHTHGHSRLSDRRWREAFDELAGCRRRLETELGRAVRTVAYPYGSHDFIVRRLTSAAGYRMAFTTDHRRTRVPGWWSRLRIPRMDFGRLMEDLGTGTAG